MSIQLFKNTAYWIFHFCKYTATTLLAGTLLGLFSFYLLGSVFTEYEPSFLLKKGSDIGFRYARVWAGGISIVLCIMKARKNYLNKHNHGSL